MKLAELCTAFPQTAGDLLIRDPGAALPRSTRLKIRTLRGHLQSALDTHPQRSANRLGLGLRPYESGDSLRALALRPLVLQEQLLTRTDVSAGRFHVSILVHSYSNMNFSSTAGGPSKNQLAWASAGVLQNLHELQAQKVDIQVCSDADLPQQLIRRAARIRRSHFCYVVTDLLFDPSADEAAARNLEAALKLLRLRRGMLVVVRDPLESPHWHGAEQGDVLTLEAPDAVHINSAENKAVLPAQLNSGSGYVRNLKNQLSDAQFRLGALGWSSVVVTPDEDLSELTRNVSLAFAGQRSRR